MKKTLTMAAIALGLIMISAGAMAADTAKPVADAKAPVHQGEKHRGDRFAKADKNSDGFITKEEMAAVQKEKMDKMFAKLDTDKDGKLSKAEMETGKKQMREKMKAHWDKKKEGKADTAAPEKAPE